MKSEQRELYNETLQKKQEIVEEPKFMSINMQTNGQNVPIYQTPLTFHQSSHKIFHPMEWSIQNFQIGRHLGRGRFGHVYLARQRKSKHIVALKVFSKKQIVKDQIFSQIRRQIQIHSHLNHQNILKMFGFFFDQLRIYCIMEYAANGQLYNQLKKERKFQQAKTRKIISQVIEALKYIKSHNIIHRDIKPENILLDENDKVKLSDFGWSIKSNSNSRTTYCGTFDYLCPQMIRNRPYDESVDIWCLGILTYQLACGSTPFAQGQKSKSAKNVVFGQPSYPPYFSYQLIDFIDKCLQKVASKRILITQAENHPWIAQQKIK